MGGYEKQGTNRFAADYGMNEYQQATQMLESMKKLGGPRNKSNSDDDQQTEAQTYMPQVNMNTMSPKPTFKRRQSQYCPVHNSGELMLKNSSTMQDAGRIGSSKYDQYPGETRQIGAGQRIRFNSNVVQCTCTNQSQLNGYSQIIHTVQQPLKKVRAIAKQKIKRRSHGSRNEYTPEEEAEIKEIFNSDQSCRQLFSNKKDEL